MVLIDYVIKHICNRVMNTPLIYYGIHTPIHQLVHKQNISFVKLAGWSFAKSSFEL